MKIYLILMCYLILTVHAVQAQDNSDIYLAKLNLSDKQAVTDFVRLTNFNNYTNQPYFFAHDKVYFTQMLGQGSGQQTDIFVYNMMSKDVTNVTQSPESEYSPTPLPMGKGMSVIRVNAAGKQELWALDEEGQPVEHLVPAVEPVGYHVWLNKQELLLFVLGEPNTLQRVDSSQKDAKYAKTTIIDSMIGASLYQFKNSNWFLYSKTEEGNTLKAYNRRSNKTIVVTDMPEDSQYFSISAAGHVITSDGNALYQRQLISNGEGVEAQGRWQAMPISAEKCQSGISRTAISHHGDMIALVCPH